MLVLCCGFLLLVLLLLLSSFGCAAISHRFVCTCDRVFMHTSSLLKPQPTRCTYKSWAALQLYSRSRVVHFNLNLLQFIELDGSFGLWSILSAWNGYLVSVKQNAQHKTTQQIVKKLNNRSYMAISNLVFLYFHNRCPRIVAKVRRCVWFADEKRVSMLRRLFAHRKSCRFHSLRFLLWH